MRGIVILLATLGFSIVTALAVRTLLMPAELNGVTLLSIGIADLKLQYTVNTGVNFGLAGADTGSRQFLLAALALAVCAAVILWAIKSGRTLHAAIAGLFAGGGLANAYERVAYGGVFDYLNVPLSFYDNPYSFNLADVYIFAGALLFIFRPNQNASEEGANT